ncbi:MAG TPA: hypothetical protein VMN99_02025 [Anaerolineales bacterium]|nr:hypothetical protein [Anaerolineales bacterium]
MIETTLPQMDETLTILHALSQGGYLRIVYGSVAQGSYLCKHPQVDELHLTGSANTFEGAPSLAKSVWLVKSALRG